MKKWLCYFINSCGHRDGQEYITAQDKAEALQIYQHFFNLSRYDDCRVIPVIGASIESR